MAYNGPISITPPTPMPSRLIVYEDDEPIGERLLDRERVHIGRRPHNDLVLPHSAVSGDHALVITVRNDSFLEDLHSTNGTWVNGRMVTKRLLQDGDEIRIARYVLKYCQEECGVDEMAAGEESPSQEPAWQEEAAATFQDFNRTQVQRRYPDVSPPDEEARPEAGSLPLGALRVISGPAAGKEVALGRSLTTLGKPGIQVAVITRQKEGYSLAYVEGDSYPLVNGSPVEEDEHTSLEHLDDVEIAGVRMKFILQRPPAGAEETDGD